MGRYDKIKVYDGSSWRTPSRIRAYYGGSWLDFGSNTDTAARRVLRVRTSNSMVTCTKHAVVNPPVSTNYRIRGSFTLNPTAGYCFRPRKAEWYFRGYIRKISSGSKNIFYHGTGSPSNKGSTYISIVWNDDGTITVSGRYDKGTVRTITTSNSVGTNSTVYLSVRAPKISSGYATVTISFNGVQTSFINYSEFSVSNTSNQVGDSGIEFYNTLEVKGYAYSGSANSVSINCSTASGSTSEYNNVTSVHDESPGSTSWVDD